MVAFKYVPILFTFAGSHALYKQDLLSFGIVGRQMGADLILMAYKSKCFWEK